MTIPVLICSAGAAVSDFPEEHGVWVFPKPFEVKDLLDLVERALRDRPARVPAAGFGWAPARPALLPPGL